MSLSTTDLEGIKAIIDLAASRGAFKPAEMAAIGALYNKLDAFLKEFEEQMKNAESEGEAQGENQDEDGEQTESTNQVEE